MTSLDDDALVGAINAVADVDLTVEGRAEQGTLGGAILVNFADGRPGVVTRSLESLADARRTAGVLAELRHNSVPVPLHHLVVSVGDDVLMIQQRLPGNPPAAVTPNIVDAIIELNERFAGLLEHRMDVPTVALHLNASGDPFPRHEVLEYHSIRSQQILSRIHSIGQGEAGPASAYDLVHIDLTPDNVLFDTAGQVSGVVDWNLGAYRGDRHLALVKTRFDLEWKIREPGPAPTVVEAASHLDTFLAETVHPSTLRQFWAHRILYQLHWTLPSAPPDVVEWHLDFAESRLGRGVH